MGNYQDSNHPHAKKGKENLKIPTGSRSGMTLSNVDKVNTQSEIAKELGWSTGKEKYQQTVGRPSSDKSLSTIDNDKHNTRKEILAEKGKENKVEAGKEFHKGSSNAFVNY